MDEIRTGDNRICGLTSGIIDLQTTGQQGPGRKSEVCSAACKIHAIISRAGGGQQHYRCEASARSHSPICCGQEKSMQAEGESEIDERRRRVMGGLSNERPARKKRRWMTTCVGERVYKREQGKKNERGDGERDRKRSNKRSKIQGIIIRVLLVCICYM